MRLSCEDATPSADSRTFSMWALSRVPPSTWGARTGWWSKSPNDPGRPRRSSVAHRPRGRRLRLACGAPRASSRAGRTRTCNPRFRRSERRSLSAQTQASQIGSGPLRSVCAAEAGKDRDQSTEASHPSGPEGRLPQAAADRAKNSNQNGFVRMARAAAGSLLFLVLAPGVVAGLVPLLQPRLELRAESRPCPIPQEPVAHVGWHRHGTQRWNPSRGGSA